MEKVLLSDELQRLTPLTDAQRRELGERLAHRRAHSDEPGLTLDEIRCKLVAGQRQRR